MSTRTRTLPAGMVTSFGPAGAAGGGAGFGIALSGAGAGLGFCVGSDINYIKQN